jgi:hypothetical protein
VNGSPRINAFEFTLTFVVPTIGQFDDETLASVLLITNTRRLAHQPEYESDDGDTLNDGVNTNKLSTVVRFTIAPTLRPAMSVSALKYSVMLAFCTQTVSVEPNGVENTATVNFGAALTLPKGPLRSAHVK